MDTHDYISQCTSHLSSDTYQLVQEYPSRQIAATAEAILDQFRQPLFQYNKRLIHYLWPKLSEGQVLSSTASQKFISHLRESHQSEQFVAQCNSMLAPTAKFIDHVPQPLSQSYPDYLPKKFHIASATMDNMQIPDDAILDVESLPVNSSRSVLILSTMNAS